MMCKQDYIVIAVVEENRGSRRRFIFPSKNPNANFNALKS